MVFFFLFFFLIFNVYLFLRQRETEHERGRGREREGDTESEAGLQAPSHQPRARRGARTHGPRDRDLSRSRTLNRLSHPGAPKIIFLNITTDFQQKSLCVLGSCQAHGNRYKFSQILIFTWKLEFQYWLQILSVVFPEVTATLHSFFEIYRSNTQVYITVHYFLTILSSKNYFLWPSSTWHSNKNVFPWASSSSHHKYFVYTFRVITQNIQDMVSG